MFEFLFREKIFETSDSKKKFEVGCKLKENHIDYVLHSHSGCTSCGVYLECIGESCDVYRIVDVINEYLRGKWLKVEVLFDNHLNVISLL